MHGKTDATAERRHFEIDFLKAISIVAVVLIHAMRDPWHPRVSATEVWLGHLTRFAVPAFFFSSGFLYGTTERVPLATTLRRLRRILIPYLIASLLAELWNAQQGRVLTPSSVLNDLLLGSAFGPFYFIFVLVCFVLVSPLLAAVPRSLLAVFLIALFAWQGRLEVGPPLHSVFWFLRHPALWGPYFLAGWLVRLHHRSIGAWSSRHRTVLLVSFGALFVAFAWASAGAGSREFMRIAAWLNIYVSMAIILVAFRGATRATGAVRKISDATYAVYLFHLFFVLPVQQAVVPVPRRLDLIALGAAWAAGLLGSALVILLGRAALGPRARGLLGA